jgi:hypothetical protein
LPPACSTATPASTANGLAATTPAGRTAGDDGGGVAERRRAGTQQAAPLRRRRTGDGRSSDECTVQGARHKRLQLCRRRRHQHLAPSTSSR